MRALLRQATILSLVARIVAPCVFTPLGYDWHFIISSFKFLQEENEMWSPSLYVCRLASYFPSHTNLNELNIKCQSRPKPTKLMRSNKKICNGHCPSYDQEQGLAIVSQDMQTRFSVQLAFAKFLSKIKGNIWGSAVSMILALY